ncbi:MAG: SMC-Scp complex subunit ScpB [Coriobacteriia bacterium]|nr:SMC-Scp complex subunit ScpB [Coriobacteriia bacterium]
MESAIEALLFTSSEAISSAKLAQILEVDSSEVEKALKRLQNRLEEQDSGICLKQIAGGWRLFSAPQHHDLIEKYVLSLDTRKLSEAAIETLAIIAYSQPVTRGGVASARGVNSDSSINSLIEKGLVREAGTADAPGNPILYATTTAFLEHFGLSSLKDMPKLDDFAPSEETLEFIRERLSATHIEAEPEPEQEDMFDNLEIDTDSE